MSSTKTAEEMNIYNYDLPHDEKIWLYEIADDLAIKNKAESLFNLFEKFWNQQLGFVVFERFLFFAMKSSANKFKAETPSLPSQPVPLTENCTCRNQQEYDLCKNNCGVEFFKEWFRKYDEAATPHPTDNSFEEEAAELYPIVKTIWGDEDYVYKSISNERNKSLQHAYIKGRQKTTSLERDSLARKIITDFQVFIENNNGQFPGEGFIEDYLTRLK